MQTVQTVTLEDVIALVVPPTSGGYLRLLSGDVERFFQPLGSRWSGLPGQPDGVDAFCTAHNADTGVSPIVWMRRRAMSSIPPHQSSTWRRSRS